MITIKQTFYTVLISVINIHLCNRSSDVDRAEHSSKPGSSKWTTCHFSVNKMITNKIKWNIVAFHSNYEMWQGFWTRKWLGEKGKIQELKKSLKYNRVQFCVKIKFKGL